MKSKLASQRVLDLRDQIDLREHVDAVLLLRVRAIVLQRGKRKRKLQAV